MGDLIVLGIIGLVFLYFLGGYIASRIALRTTTLRFPYCIDDELKAFWLSWGYVTKEATLYLWYYKDEKERKRRLTTCPTCGSKNFTHQSPFLTTPVGTMSIGGYEKCHDCGYYKSLGGGDFF